MDFLTADLTDLADLLRFPFLISDSLMKSHTDDTDDTDCSDDSDGVI